MQIDEAIETLETEISTWPREDTGDYYDSIKLGIEALKFIRGSRGKPKGPVPTLLRGETKDMRLGMTETRFINPETD